MIAAAMIGYGVLMVGLVVVVGYLTGQQVNRELTAATDRAIQRSREAAARTPPLPPYVREPLPEWQESEPELRITIRLHPESENGELPKLAAEVIREASRLEESYGGDGLEYDEAGSVEEPGRLVLRLVPRLDDWEAADRLAAVSEELNRAARRAEEREEDRFAAGIRARIERQLQPHLPPGVVERIEVADGAVEESVK